MGAALVLNATYEPLCVVPLRRAVVLVLAEKALVVEASERVMHSERLSVPIPTVVRLARFVRVPYRRDVPLTRRAVLDRDAHGCVYCGARADTIDHVRPRSRAASTSGRMSSPHAPGATTARAIDSWARSAGRCRRRRCSRPRPSRSSWVGPRASRRGIGTSA